MQSNPLGKFSTKPHPSPLHKWRGGTRKALSINGEGEITDGLRVRKDLNAAKSGNEKAVVDYFAVFS